MLARLESMLAPRALALAFALTLACGSSASDPAPPAATTPPPDDPQPPPYPAIAPSMPAAKSSGGPILATPNIIPIFFPGDADQDTLTTFVRALPSSAYWKEITSEYGVGATTTGDPIVVTNETAPQTITDPEVKTW